MFVKELPVMNLIITCTRSRSLKEPLSKFILEIGLEDKYKGI